MSASTEEEAEKLRKQPQLEFEVFERKMLRKIEEEHEEKMRQLEEKREEAMRQLEEGREEAMRQLEEEREEVMRQTKEKTCQTKEKLRQFTEEIHQLEEKARQLKEGTRQLEEEARQLKEGTRQIEEENEENQRQHEERMRQLEEENEENQRQHEERMRQLEEENEENQRQHEERMRRLEEEARQFKGKTRQLEEEMRQMKEEEEEKNRQDEGREARIRKSQPLTLYQLLDTCHVFSLSMKMVTNQPLISHQSHTKNPTGRFYPRRIIPWTTFTAKQEEIWCQISSNPSFSSHTNFPSWSQLEFAKSMTHSVVNEFTLRNYHRSMVESMVRNLMDATNKDPLSRSRLNLDGNVMFQTQMNLNSYSESSSESNEQISLGADNHETPSQVFKPSHRLTRHRKSRGKSNEVDYFCLYHTSDDQKIPIVAIEYKPPHKLTRDEIITGLASEIQPDRDIINKNGEGFAFAARKLATAIITKLFSYMVGKGVRYGYICTGEVYIFLHIPDDPFDVYYSVCVPELDVQGGGDKCLHRTAVAQVFAFTLQAIQSPPPSQAWHSAAEDHDLWFMEYEDILESIPAKVREEKCVALYKPQRWTGSEQSPMQANSTPFPLESDEQQPGGDDSKGGVSSARNRVDSQRQTSNILEDLKSNGQREAQQRDSTMRPSIQDRPYCTHKCLHGIAFGDPMDEECPNFSDHGSAHISQQQFLDLIRSQLAKDRGPDADCMPLYLSGSRGSLFKVRLSSRGYTLIAKGMEAMDIAHLKHENEVYNHIRSLQGKYVPVCLGIADLIRPYYYDSGIFEHFLFLSYAGKSSFKYIRHIEAKAVDEIITGCLELHKHRVLHCDAELRNILYDTRDNRCMIVDFERAEIRPHGPVNPSIQNQKAKRDDFMRELHCLRYTLSKCVSTAG